MTASRTMITLTGLALAALAGTAQAQESGLSAQAEAAFQSMDGNGDGLVTGEELAATLRTQFEAADQNGDGALDAEEFGGERMAPARERIDSDGDGRITLDEFLSARQPEEAIAQLDADGDGALSREEYAAAIERTRQQRQ